MTPAPIAPAPPKNSQNPAPDVMGALKKESGKAPDMSAQDIVKHDCETSKCPVPWKNVYAGLVTAVKSPKYRIMRANNSLLCYSISSPKSVEVHVITADQPRQLVDSLGQFYACLLYTSPSPRDRTRSRMPSSA